MNNLHRVYLSLGSNIDPEINLPKAVTLLRQHGRIPSVSSAWESHAIGARGPNFLNAVVLLFAAFELEDIKPLLIQPVEDALGRARSDDKFAPRTMDIDTILYDGNPQKLDCWEYAYVICPMAELLPDLQHPMTQQKMSVAAQQAQQQAWIIRRLDILLDQ